MNALAQGARRVQQRFEVWAMDEHRVGLKPILGKVWSLRGQRPTVIVQPRYQWLYVYAFVQPTTGRSFYVLLPTVNKAAFHVALREFATCVQATQDTQILTLVDNAGWHSHLDQPLPPGLGLRYLPPYSPELQPAEHLWHLTDAPLINRCFDALDDLETALAERCRWLMAHPDLVKSATLFPWWPTLHIHSIQ